MPADAEGGRGHQGCGVLIGAERVLNMIGLIHYDQYYSGRLIHGITATETRIESSARQPHHSTQQQSHIYQPEY